MVAISCRDLCVKAEQDVISFKLHVKYQGNQMEWPNEDILINHDDI